MTYKKVDIGDSVVYFGKCEDILPSLDDSLVDSVITDPPYMYLNHKLDIPFDEELVFTELNRILKNDKMIAFFGRGDSFYRWNLMLSDLGFKFKESAVWDKNAPSNFLCNFHRVHEDICFRSKGTKSINKSYIDYFDYQVNNGRLDVLEQAFKRMKSALNSKNRDEVIRYIETSMLEFNSPSKTKHKLTAGDFNQSSREVGVFKTVKNGKIETSIMRCKKEQFKYEHPTQKPVELMKRIISLTTNENETVIDPFMGGGSTGVACVASGRRFIGIECDEEYFNVAVKRITEAYENLDREKIAA